MGRCGDGNFENVAFKLAYSEVNNTVSNQKELFQGFGSSAGYAFVISVSYTHTTLRYHLWLEKEFSYFVFVIILLIQTTYYWCLVIGGL